MPLSRLISVVSAYLNGALDVPSLGVGSFYPTVANELPRITLSVSNAEQQLSGVGRRPRAEVEGALPVSISLDLADPVVAFPDETVTLVSTDRRTITLPHGPVVRANGLDTLPFTAADITVEVDDTPWTLVSGTPSGQQFNIDPQVGQVRTGAALPAAGQLDVSYHAGRWEVQTFRTQGELTAEIFAGTTALVDEISNDMLDALRLPGALPTLGKLIATGLGPIDRLGPERANSRSRKVTFHFDYELEEPVVRTGGGIITRILVDAVADGQIERFEVIGVRDE